MLESNGLITIVVPVYNVEKYLERCVNSIVNQTYQNLEIILVDDGSPDHCPEMCEEFAKKDSRIRVIHKQNAGLGMARNTGIDHASGEYIYFVDSDDYIALNTIELCYQLARKTNADIVTFGYSDVGSDGRIHRVTIPKVEREVYAGEEVQKVFLQNLIAPDIETGKTTNLTMTAWASFFSMRLIHKTQWRFVSEREIISEDYFSQLCLYRHVDKVAVLPESLYFYCENSTSLTHVYKRDRLEKNTCFYKRCIEVCDKLGYPQGVKNRIGYAYASNLIGAMKIIAQGQCSSAEKKRYLNEIFKEPTFRLVLSEMNLKHEKKTRKILLYAIRWRLFAVSRLLVMLKTCNNRG